MELNVKSGNNHVEIKFDDDDNVFDATNFVSQIVNAVYRAVKERFGETSGKIMKHMFNDEFVRRLMFINSDDEIPVDEQIKEGERIASELCDI